VSEEGGGAVGPRGPERDGAALSGGLRRALCRALLSAFPRLPDLEQLVSFTLDRNLEAIVPAGCKLKTVVFKLVEYTERHGLTLTLAEAALTEVPGNPALLVLLPRIRLALEPTKHEEEGTGPPPRMPFPGLAFFDEGMADLFFGRTGEIKAATARLGGLRGYHRRWLQIDGPSGVGKSSLARAGLVPAVRNGLIAGAPKQWRVVVVRPGKDPVLNLVTEITGAFGVTAHTLDTLVGDMRRSPTALKTFLRTALPKGEGFLLLVDQFEELFTLAEAEKWAPFARLLAALVLDTAVPLYLVTTVRSDFEAHMGELPELGALLNDETKAARYSLHRMTEDELRQSMEGPAKIARLRWGRALVARMIEDARASAGGLPLVAHVLQELWRRSGGKKLTNEAYTELGGVGGALTKSADDILDSLGDAGKEQAKKMLLRLVKTGRGVEDVRQSMSRADVLALAGGDKSATDVLARLSGGAHPDRPEGDGVARLVVVSEQQVELVHEALIKEWVTLRMWLTEGREGLALRDDVEVAAHMWTERGEPEHELPGEGLTIHYRKARGLCRHGERFLAAAEEQQRKKQRRAKRLNLGRAAAILWFLLVLIANTALIMRDRERTKRTQIAEANETNATMAANSVLSYLRSLSDAVHSVAEEGSLARALEEGRIEQLDEICERSYAFYDDPAQGLKTDERSPFFLWFVLDTEGIIRSYSIGESDPRFDQLKWGSYVHRDYFKGARALAAKKQHQTYVSGGFSSTMNELYQFAISAPIYGSDGEWKGALVAAVTTRSKLGSLDMDEGQDIAVLAAPEDPTGLNPGFPPESPPDPPRYVILRHPLFKDGESSMLDNAQVRRLGRDSQENEKHIEKWWELPGSRWVRSSNDYEDPLGHGYQDKKVHVWVPGNPAYQGRRQASFAPVGHTGFVVIVRTKEGDPTSSDWKLVRQLATWVGFAALPGLLLLLYRVLSEPGGVLVPKKRQPRAPAPVSPPTPSIP
jgi:hypothetical protein